MITRQGVLRSQADAFPKVPSIPAAARYPSSDVWGDRVNRVLIDLAATAVSLQQLEVKSLTRLAGSSTPTARRPGFQGT